MPPVAPDDQVRGARSGDEGWCRSATPVRSWRTPQTQIRRAVSDQRKRFLRSLTLPARRASLLDCRLEAEVLHQERPLVGGFLDDLCSWLAGAVACLRLDADQHRVRAEVIRLQRRGELETVTRHDAVVRVGGCYQCRGVRPLP